MDRPLKELKRKIFFCFLLILIVLSKIIILNIIRFDTEKMGVESESSNVYKGTN